MVSSSRNVPMNLCSALAGVLLGIKRTREELMSALTVTRCTRRREWRTRRTRRRKRRKRARQRRKRRLTRVCWTGGPNTLLQSRHTWRCVLPLYSDCCVATTEHPYLNTQYIWPLFLRLTSFSTQGTEGKKHSILWNIHNLPSNIGIAEFGSRLQMHVCEACWEWCHVENDVMLRMMSCWEWCHVV